MPARTAIHPNSPNTRRARRGGAAHAQRRPAPRSMGSPIPLADSAVEPRRRDDEQFRVASRDRLIPRPRGGQERPRRISFEVLLALAVVVACIFGALAVGSAFTLQI